MEGRFRLVLKSYRRGRAVQLRAPGDGGREATVLRVGGKASEELFWGALGALRRRGLVELEKETRSSYRALLKAEAGPTVGGFLVLARRAKEVRPLLYLLERALDGDAVLRVFLPSLLRLAEEMSGGRPSPKVLDSLSAGAKEVVRKLWRVKL
ncbi:MAG: hypothetical protein N3F67_02220 [Acidilobaceae archaeon]|nr:hypothetical protein [Acidilobaceae archaeon]